MNRAAKVFMGILILAAAGCSSQDTARSTEPPSPSQAGKEVDQLFASMRAGQYNDISFPKLTWGHIPALLDLSESRRMLQAFPQSPLSSQSEAQCSEGMVALWLIEGIRKQNLQRESREFGYPSLNALCLPQGPLRTTNWGQVSEDNHPVVASHYRQWWAQHGTEPVDQAAKVDLLRGTGLHWF